VGLQVRMPRLPMRRLPVRLERLLGLWRLWRLRLGLLLVLGPLSLVLDGNSWRRKRAGQHRVPLRGRREFALGAL
jgi:hypothetical protein